MDRETCFVPGPSADATDTVSRRASNRIKGGSKGAAGDVLNPVLVTRVSFVFFVSSPAGG